MLHLTTSFAAVLALGGRVVQQWRPGRRLLLFGLLASLGVAVGAAWEVGEWAIDAAWGGIIRGDDDTMLDLISDAIGSVVGALVWTSLADTARAPEGRSSPWRPQSMLPQP